jgi:hypothetical protein
MRRASTSRDKATHSITHEHSPLGLLTKVGSDKRLCVRLQPHTPLPAHVAAMHSKTHQWMVGWISGCNRIYSDRHPLVLLQCKLQQCLGQG